MKTYTKHIITTIIRCLLIFLFCYTAVSKWLSYDALLYQLQQSPFLPGGYTFLSFALPALELAITVCLALSATAKAALAASAVVLTIFTVYIICMLLFASDVPCSCGGFITFLSWKQHIIFNTTGLIISIWGYVLQPGWKEVRIVEPV